VKRLGCFGGWFRRRDASEVRSVLPSVAEYSPSPTILAIFTGFLALSLQYPQTEMRSAPSHAYNTVVAKTVSLLVSLDSFQIILYPFEVKNAYVSWGVMH
jgi:hypothetical protein